MNKTEQGKLIYGKGYHEVTECPLNIKIPAKSLIFKRDRIPVRFAIVDETGDFVNWESPREDEEAQKIIATAFPNW